MTRWRALGGVVIAAGLVAAVAMVTATPPCETEPPTRVRRGAFDPSRPPLAGGVEMSLAEAVDAVPFPIVRPSADLASDEELCHVWVNTKQGSRSVYMQYDSGAVVTVRPGGPPTTEFAAAQIADGVPGRIESIAGVTAFVVSAPDQPGGDSVRLVMRGVVVVIMGIVDPPEQSLIEAARSVVETADAVEVA